jgi:outer membrane protein TolC
MTNPCTTAGVMAASLLTVQLAQADPLRDAASARGDGPVEALVAEALARNPEIRAAAEFLRAARARPKQAEALADPTFIVSYTNDGWSPSLGESPDASLGFSLAQDLPWPGKRRLRGAIAERQADQVEQQVARARLAVAARVRRGYAALAEARALLGLTREQADVWREIEAVARSRYSAGQGSQQDVLRAQVELTRVGQFVAEGEANETIRLAELNRLLDRPAQTPLETVDTPPVATPAPPLHDELEQLRARSPERHAARAALEARQLGLDLARKAALPDLTLLGGYMNRGGLDPMWQAGIALNLPIRRARRQGAVAEAEAEVRAAEAALESVELQLRFRTQERLAQLQAALTAAAIYADGVVPQDRMSVEAALAGYQTGRVPFVAVLEALTTLYLDRGALVRLRSGSAQIRASLEEASLESTSDLPGMAAPAPATGTSLAVPGAGGADGTMRSMNR